jgi:hypothetical protein
MSIGMMTGLYEAPGTMILGLILISIWTLIWKGFALWHSAKNEQKGWFIATLILNTMGLLPIIYLIWFKPECKECEVKEKVVDKKKAVKRVVKKVAKKTNKKVTKKTVSKKATTKKKRN